MNNVIKFLCLNALLIGSASLAMDPGYAYSADAKAMADRPGNSNSEPGILSMRRTPGAVTDKGQELCKAAKAGNLELVKSLLDAGVSVDEKGHENGTPLKWAAYKGRKEVCQLLIDRNANINTKDIYGWTPLMPAAQNGHTEICRLLIDTRIKQIDKAAAITLLGMSRLNRATCMNGIDRNVIRLIARYVVDADTKNLFAQIGTTKYEDLFAQINAIYHDGMCNNIRAYAQAKIKNGSKNK